MSEYSLYDFVESIAGAHVEESDVASVRRAWGDSPEGYASWEGGFVLAMKDGRYAYVFGWCDTSGWGCQDGVTVQWHDSDPGTPPTQDNYLVSPPSEEWDEEPADLNRWLAAGCPDIWEWERRSQGRR